MYIRHWRFLTLQRNLTPPDTSYGCYKSFVLEYSPMHADILPTGLDYSMSMEHCWGSQAYPTQQAHTVFKFRLHIFHIPYMHMYSYILYSVQCTILTFLILFVTIGVFSLPWDCHLEPCLALGLCCYCSKLLHIIFFTFSFFLLQTSLFRDSYPSCRKTVECFSRNKVKPSGKKPWALLDTNDSMNTTSL